MKLPKIHVTKNGKRYININGRKLYLEAGVTKKQIPFTKHCKKQSNQRNPRCCTYLHRIEHLL